jgi:pimeloyl-ACP methyl ester carboxylesterase
VEVVLRAGHSVHQERPEAFARVLAAHLANAAETVSSSTSA